MTIIQFIQYLIKLPIHLLFFIFKFIVASLNLIPLSWIIICKEESYMEYSPYHKQSTPKSYIIELPLKIHLGSFLVAYIRNAYQKSSNSR